MSLFFWFLLSKKKKTLLSRTQRANFYNTFHSYSHTDFNLLFQKLQTSTQIQIWWLVLSPSWDPSRQKLRDTFYNLCYQSVFPLCVKIERREERQFFKIFSLGLWRRLSWQCACYASMERWVQIPSRHMKKSDTEHVPGSQHWGGRDRTIPVARWPETLAKQAGSRSVRDSVSKNKVTEKDTRQWPLACTHIHIQNIHFMLLYDRSENWIKVIWLHNPSKTNLLNICCYYIGCVGSWHIWLTLLQSSPELGTIMLIWWLRKLKFRNCM